MKVCTNCNLEKSLEEFYFRKDSNNYRNECKKCLNKKTRQAYQDNYEERQKYYKEYRQKNKEKRNEYSKAWYRENKPIKRKWDSEYGRRTRLKSRYGLSPDDIPDYCEVCGRHESEVPRNVICVDHCHNTGEVRGFLCRNCNLVLGLVNDNPKILEKLTQYLYERGKDG